MPEPLEFPTFVDDRGTLLPVELDDVPFGVRRVFVVRGNEGEARERGQHTADCQELVVLVSGRAVFTVVEGETPGRSVALTVPGQTFSIETDELVSYTLDGPDSTILVLASERYEPRR